eukprot:SAG11_NODE_512_length_8839_cov_5.600572_7_plen_159_part_00
MLCVPHRTAPLAEALEMPVEYIAPAFGFQKNFPFPDNDLLRTVRPRVGSSKRLFLAPLPPPPVVPRLLRCRTTCILPTTFRARRVLLMLTHDSVHARSALARPTRSARPSASPWASTVIREWRSPRNIYEYAALARVVPRHYLARAAKSFPLMLCCAY